MKCSSEKLLCPFQTCVCNSCSCFLISASHLSFPAYWLVHAFHAPSPSLFHWKGLIDAAYRVLCVASSKRKHRSELSLRNSAWVCDAHAINSTSTDSCSMGCGWPGARGGAAAGGFGFIPNDVHQWDVSISNLPV